MAATSKSVQDEDVALAAEGFHILDTFRTSGNEEVIAAMALGAPNWVACRRQWPAVRVLFGRGNPLGDGHEFTAPMHEHEGDLVDTRAVALGIGTANCTGSTVFLLKKNLAAALTKERGLHHRRIDFGGGTHGESFTLVNRRERGIDTSAARLPAMEGLSDLLE